MFSIWVMTSCNTVLLYNSSMKLFKSVASFENEYKCHFCKLSKEILQTVSSLLMLNHIILYIVLFQIVGKE